MNTTTKENTQTEKQERSGIFEVGDIVEGPVIAIDRSTVYINLSPVGTGIIYGKEFTVAKDILRKIRIGDTVSAKIIERETPDGYIDLSLKEARNAYIWSEAEESMKSGRVYDIIVKNANRGGLVIEWNGIRGFLPASHLAENHYPKVFNGDKENILSELKKLIGEKLFATIENVDPENDMLIFSEKKNEANEKKTVAKGESLSYKIGDVKNGIVTGVIDFGVFVTVDNAIEGLVHISEMDWGLVDDPRRFYSVGNQVQVKIIGIEDNKYSFSFKELHKNPWEDVLDRHQIGGIASGVIIKYGQFGAFASIEAGITGLIHISHFKDEEDMRNSLEIGKTYEFVITTLEPEKQKLTLVPKDRYNEKKEREEKKAPTA